MPATIKATEGLEILAKRLEESAATLERVRLDGYAATAEELRNFAAMVRRAKAYLAGCTRIS